MFEYLPPHWRQRCNVSFDVTGGVTGGGVTGDGVTGGGVTGGGDDAVGTHTLKNSSILVQM